MTIFISYLMDNNQSINCLSLSLLMHLLIFFSCFTFFCNIFSKSFYETTNKLNCTNNYLQRKKNYLPSHEKRVPTDFIILNIAGKMILNCKKLLQWFVLFYPHLVKFFVNLENLLICKRF